MGHGIGLEGVKFGRFGLGKRWPKQVDPFRQGHPQLVQVGSDLDLPEGASQALAELKALLWMDKGFVWCVHLVVVADRAHRILCVVGRIAPCGELCAVAQRYGPSRHGVC